MDSIENIIERVGRNICLYQEHAVPLPEFSEDDLKYFPICYLEKYVTSIELQKIWDKLPEKHKNNPVLKLNLPCLKHFNNNKTEGATQFDGPPPPIRSCSTSMTVMIEGIIAVCVIVNQVLFCTAPSKFLYENNEGNLSLPKVVHKLKILFINGTVTELPTDWFKIDIPSVSSDLYILCIAAISYFEELCEEKLMTGPVYFKKAREVYVNSNMNSKWENVLTSILRSPTTTEQTRKRIVPDKVYNIGDAIKIIYNSNANPHHIMLKYEEREPIRFTYEEFVKFTDFVFKFMDDEDFVYGFIDCVVPNWFDFVIGQYIFLSCWKNEKTCGLAIQDTKSTDYITLNENEIAMFKTHKYKLYEFLKNK
ncbi:hypothetical protein ABEB36_010662 [Hypothenemus hampei]|uniref:Uncharacterized protein n=1 Tax=Hypothenemus hampei TaxID=57062 RepID=A0ABD1ECY2_HYPHA